MSEAAIIEVHELEKRYVGVQALKGVSMAVEAGSVHGLVGENGAGKSTLGKVIGGIVQPDAGDLLFEGRPVRYASPRQALEDGIAVIQQELALVPELTVAQNVFLGVEVNRYGLIREEAVRDRFSRLEARTGFGLAPGAPVGELSVADQQKVEILRALARDARVIVMDEPTSSLGKEESDQLHAVVRSLSEEGMTVIYISHFLEEVIEITDRVTIFRNGELIETVESGSATVGRLVEAMLGQPVSATFPGKMTVAADSPVALQVDGLGREEVFSEISFEVRAGEILGFAGLVGSGRTEVAKAVFGADRPDRGTVSVYGEEIKRGDPARSIGAGLAFAPEDRKKEGLLLELSQRMNVSLPHLAGMNGGGFVRAGEERRRVGELLRRLDVVPQAPEQPVSNLSGGNQQKVLFAKWLLGEPRVLILDEPTRGVDIGAKAAIYDLIVSLAAEGLAVVVISSELEEILGLSHRVMVMRGGQIERELDVESMSSDAIMHASFGVHDLDQAGGVK